MAADNIKKNLTFSQKLGIGILRKISPNETICMKYSYQK